MAGTESDGVRDPVVEAIAAGAVGTESDGLSDPAIEAIVMLPAGNEAEAGAIAQHDYVARAEAYARRVIASETLACKWVITSAIVQPLNCVTRRQSVSPLSTISSRK